MMRDWYRIAYDAEKDQESVDIHIVDFVGGWNDEYWIEGGGPGVVTAKQFLKDLSEIPDSVKALRVHINSPGGDVYGGVNIANALRAERAKGRSVETIVDGLAGSIASVIAMAGQPLTMADTALLMIHNPFTYAAGGDAVELRAMADALDKMRAASIIPAYQWHTDKSPEEIADLMDAVTWMSADDAIAAGFADAKIEGLKAAASIDPRFVARMKIPEQYAQRVAALVREPEEPATIGTVEVKLDASDVDKAIDDALAVNGQPVTVEPTSGDVPSRIEASIGVEDLVALCADAGLDLDFARGLFGERLTAAQAAERVAAEKGKRQAEDARVTEIRALGEKFGQQRLAETFVSGGMTVDAARQAIAIAKADADKVEIDSSLSPDHGQKRGTVIDIAAIYAERNGLQPAQKER